MLEILGTEGPVLCPDPNQFTGDVLLWIRKTKEWKTVPLTHNGDMERGIGLADMADAIHERRPHRANGELALHIVEIMEAFDVSARAEKKVALKSTCRRPEPLPAGLPLGKLA